jgi:hypothetical protein
MGTYVRVQVPWIPSYTEAQARAAIESAASWGEVLAELDVGYHGKNIKTLRKWTDRWRISTDHLPVGRGGPRKTPPYTEDEARQAIASSKSWSEALRKLGYCPTGGNPPVLKRRAAEWGISTDHFDPYAASRERGPAIPLEEILVEGSTFSRSNLKQRLYEAGLKVPRCELCGQDEMWRGKRIGMILDHINGVRDDNRIENLRIICPNCAATLETHCGRKNSTPVVRACGECGKSYRVKYRDHRFCSPNCWFKYRNRIQPARGVARASARKIERPPYKQLKREIAEKGYCAVGRRYGVSDNAIRKWVRQYEREAERVELDEAA